MVKLCYVLIFLIFLQTLSAQSVDTDTVKISKPVEVDTLNSEITIGKIFLATSAVIGIPITTGLVMLSLSPPSYMLIQENKNLYHGFGFETSIGFGDSTRFRFSQTRFIFQFSFVENLKSRFLIALNRDVTLKRFGRYKIFGFGTSAGFFLWTNFKNFSTAGVETALWVGNAMNVPYILLFPQHHLFIKFRSGFELGSGKRVNEINIGFSSSITLKK